MKDPLGVSLCLPMPGLAGLSTGFRTPLQRTALNAGNLAQSLGVDPVRGRPRIGQLGHVESNNQVMGAQARLIVPIPSKVLISDETYDGDLTLCVLVAPVRRHVPPSTNSSRTD